MNKITFPRLSCLSARLLIFGLYCVICYAVFIMLCLLTHDTAVHDYISAILFPYILEHVIMSLALIIIGGVLLDIAVHEQKK